MSTHTEMIYGFFHGGDPRKFHPDGESNSPQELADHTAACKLWDEAEARGETPTPESCPSGWNADRTIHVLRSKYGLGLTECEVEDEPPGAHYGPETSEI